MDSIAVVRNLMEISICLLIPMFNFLYYCVITILLYLVEFTHTVLFCCVSTLQ